MLNNCKNFYPEEVIYFCGSGKTMTLVPKTEMPSSPTVVVGPTGPMGVIGPMGPMGFAGPTGPTGPSPIFTVGQTITAPFGVSANVIDNTQGLQHELTFVIPQGPGGSIKLLAAIVTNEIEGGSYKNFITRAVLPIDSPEITINNDSITINEGGVYYVVLQGYIDATQTQSDVIVVQLEIDGNPLDTAAVSVPKGGFDNFHHGALLNLSPTDNIKILHAGTDDGGSTSNITLFILRLEI